MLVYTITYIMEGMTMTMRTKENQMLIDQSWESCLSSLVTEYTLSIKDICKALKCSRSWANRYIKPHLHYIYISNGYGKTKNYLKEANYQLSKDMTATTWYSKKEFEQLIKQSINSVTRQTINIPLKDIIRPDEFNKFYSIYVSLSEALDETTDYFKKKELAEALRRLKLKYATEKGYEMLMDAPSQFKRTNTPPIQIDINDFDFDVYNLMAVHDKKDYGDTDEEVYREFFETGCYRLELVIPDADGVLSEKIFYYLPNIADDVATGDLESKHTEKYKSVIKNYELVKYKYVIQ